MMIEQRRLTSSPNALRNLSGATNNKPQTPKQKKPEPTISAQRIAPNGAHAGWKTRSSKQDHCKPNSIAKAGARGLKNYLNHAVNAKRKRIRALVMN